MDSIIKAEDESMVQALAQAEEKRKRLKELWQQERKVHIIR